MEVHEPAGVRNVLHAANRFCGGRYPAEEEYEVLADAVDVSADARYLRGVERQLQRLAGIVGERPGLWMAE